MNIYLLRHAKSSWENFVDDHSRVLEKRGKDEAVTLADFIKNKKIKFDLTLCSSATRTKETLELIYENIPSAFEEIKLLESLYHASGQHILNHLQEINKSNVLLIGHNPGLSEAINFFQKKSNTDYPTCVFARISSAGLDKESEVDFIVRPKNGKIINLT
jgi:phosphohistidine phosphatase